MALSRPASTLVYSTDSGRICPTCALPQARCGCAQHAREQVLGDGRVRVTRQTQGRGGKVVTVVKGVALNAEGLAQLGKQLRSACGSGGTTKDGVIEIQGDHCERVLAWLQAQGLPAKRSGG